MRIMEKKKKLLYHDLQTVMLEYNRVYVGVILGLYWRQMGRMEKKRKLPYHNLQTVLLGYWKIKWKLV